MRSTTGIKAEGPARESVRVRDANRARRALYGDWQRRRGKPIAVADLWDLLCQAEANDWITTTVLDGQGTPRPANSEERILLRQQYEAWLPTAEHSELACDEVGLWADITPTGRAKWSEWGDRPVVPQYVLRDDCLARVVTVIAGDLLTARKALTDWNKVYYPQNQVLSVTAQPVSDLQELKNRWNLKQGVEIRAEYTVVD